MSINIVLADLQKNLINKLTATQTLTFNFKQKIADKEEIGNCFVRYPLRMKCNYKNSKGKIIISNGKTVAILKKKYKKIYLYPIKSTPLFFILEKEKIINLIRKSNSYELNSDLIGFIFSDKKTNKVKIIFDRNSFELKGWETNDSYSNKVNFEINNQILDDFFKIPQEKDL